MNDAVGEEIQRNNKLTKGKGCNVESGVILDPDSNSSKSKMRKEKNRKLYDSMQKEKRRMYERKIKMNKKVDFHRRERKRELAIQRRVTKEGSKKMNKNNEKRKFLEGEEKEAKRLCNRKYDEKQVGAD